MSNLHLATVLLSVLAAATAMRADSSNFGGHWELDPGKSSPGNAETRVLEVTQNGSNVSVIRTYTDERGRETSETYKCTIGGQECRVVAGDERHAEVSFWFDGPALVMLKTNGDKRDSTVEWRFQLKDGKTLQVSREIMAPSDTKENLTFNRTEAVATR